MASRRLRSFAFFEAGRKVSWVRILRAQVLVERRCYPGMQVGADLRPPRAMEIQERTKTSLLNGHGIVDDVRRPNSERIAELLEDMDLIHRRDGSRMPIEAPLPVELLLCVDDNGENRRVRFGEPRRLVIGEDRRGWDIHRHPPACAGDNPGPVSATASASLGVPASRSCPPPSPEQWLQERRRGRRSARTSRCTETRESFRRR